MGTFLNSVLSFFSVLFMGAATIVNRLIAEICRIVEGVVTLDVTGVAARLFNLPFDLVGIVVTMLEQAVMVPLLLITHGVDSMDQVSRVLHRARRSMETVQAVEAMNIARSLESISDVVYEEARR